MKTKDIMSIYHKENEFFYNIRKIISEFVSVFTLMAKNKGIEISCEVDNKIPDYISGSLYEFEYVLVSLLNNAIQYSNKGKVKIEIKIIDELEEEYISIILTDSSNNDVEARTKDLYDNINTTKGIISNTLMNSTITEVKIQEFLLNGTISYSFVFPYKDGVLYV